MTLLYITLVSLICGAMMLLRDFPVVEGGILASGAGERRTIKIILPVVIAAGPALIVLHGSTSVSAIQPMLPGVPFQDAFALIIAIGAAGIISNMISRFPTVPYTFIGAVFGIDLAEKGTFASGSAISFALSWALAPLLCAISAAGIYRICVACTGRRKVHLAILDRRLLTASTLASFFLLGAYSWNAGLIVGLFGNISFGGSVMAASVVAASCLLLFAVLRKHTRNASCNIADNELETNPESIFSIICAMALTFALFSAGITPIIGLTDTPLSACSLYLGSLAGISIVRKTAITDGSTICKHLAAAALSPILALLFAYSLASVLGGDTVSTLMVAGTVLLAALIALYLKSQKARALQQQIMRSREEQIHSNQKSLSALEVRTEMNEKELLNKLELKRKELVDFAVGISDQKEFMEEVYARLGKMRAMPDGPDKNKETDSILRSIRERMYFTSEVNDFYARSEVLNKDFNMRLRESFPNLSENERKLANLLRQGLSSKHIASLMNITPKSVEINRYRLRSKLGLDHGENLTKFIKSI